MHRKHECHFLSAKRTQREAGEANLHDRRVEQVVQNPLTTFSSMSSVGTIDPSSYRGSFHDTPPSENMPKASPCTPIIEAPLVKNRHRNTHTDGHKRVDSSPPSVSLFYCRRLDFFFACSRSNARHLLVPVTPPVRGAQKPKSHAQ